MKNQNISLAIILKRTQNGYTFQSLQEVTSNADKNKKSKPGRKPAIKGAPNRLIKQIGLSNQQLVPQLTPLPQPQPTQVLEEQPLQNAPIFQIPQEQQVSCEIDRQTQLPKTPAIWFSKQRIHELQKQELKQFFSGSQNKTPQLYLKYRNFMVDSYEKNPRRQFLNIIFRYLTKIGCRRILRGDVNIIIRVHAFLEKYGIINFGVAYDGNYVFKHNPLEKQYEPRTQPQSCLKNMPENDEETAEKEIDTDNMTITVINKNFSRTYRASCSNCKLICGVVWFANTVDEQAGQHNLCYECYKKLDSKEALEFTKVDVAKKMQAHGRDTKNFHKHAWNIEQNIKLLEFMSKSGGLSWKSLLNQFGGKRTIQDIVLQFLQFPISNVETKKSKKQIQRHLNSQPKTLQPQIGFNPQDYSKILKQFYQNSSYCSTITAQNKAKSKIQSEENLFSKKQEEFPTLSSVLPSDNSVGITRILNLTIEKMLKKITNLSSYEKIIQGQIINYESLVGYRKNVWKGKEDEQSMAKSMSELQVKSKSNKVTLMNGGERKINDSPYHLQNGQQVYVDGEV